MELIVFDREINRKILSPKLPANEAFPDIVNK